MTTFIDMIFTSQEAEEHYTQQSMRGSPFSAGIDLLAAIEHPITILPSEQVMIPTGIKVDMRSARTDGMAAFILPRSGRGSKEGLVLGNTVGLIDEDYHGELMVCAWARPTDGHINIANARVGGSPIRIEPWERFAQLVFVPVIYPSFNVVKAFRSSTKRGSGGFGSTGNGAVTESEGGEE